MKRFLACLLIVVMSFAMLCACGDTSANNDVNNEVENDADAEESLYRDFYEEEFWGAFVVGTDSFNYFWPEPTTEAKERTRKISAETEQLLNCKLMEEGFPATQLNASAWQQRMATGDYQFHWTSSQEATVKVYAFYNAGFIQSWNDISNVDLTNYRKWGSPRNQANASFGGELYLAGLGETGGQYGRLIFNKLLALELTNKSPQELYEAKDWTWSSFESYLESCNLNEADRRVYGMAVWATAPAARSMLPLCAVFSNGGEVVRVDDDGVATFTLGEPRAIEALDWAAKLVASDYVKLDSAWPPDTWAKGGSVFVLGDSAFGTGSSGQSAHWGLDNLEDIRFIPFPQGPQGDGSVGGAWSSAADGTVILFGVDKEDAGYVWSAKWDIGDKYKEEHDEEWIRKTFFQDDVNDTDSYDNYKFCDNNYSLDHSTQIGDQTTLMQETLFDIMRGLKTPTEGISAITSVITDSLNKAYSQG